MPSYTEIMALVGFRSKNAVYKLVNKLIDAGVLAKDSSGHLIPRIGAGEVPMLGLVEAGLPSAAEESVLDTISLEHYLAGKGGASSSMYMLEVKGDSMIDEGIKEGDLVLVERTEHAKDGDIVIAELDGGWTMKYFRKKGNKTYLEAANKRFNLMYPEESLRVAAVVRGVIRKY